jgi:aminopeptidase YwaD
VDDDRVGMSEEQAGAAPLQRPTDPVSPEDSGPAGDPLVALVEELLELLTAYPDRRVGGPGNRAATALVADRMAEWGLDVSRTAFDCIDWEPGDVVVMTGGGPYTAHPSPYTLPCDVSAVLTAASSVEELESATIRDTIVLLHGDLAREQLMPRNFTFYNPERHRRIIRALEERAPAAMLAATGRDPQMVGGQYPFPLVEDGDFDIPSAYLTDVDGGRLLAHVGEKVALSIASRRVRSTGEQIVARLPGEAPGRIVVFAHIDSRQGSPGALDNASGVAVLLGLARLLAEEAARGNGVRGAHPSVELVPLNGEDNYANPGEMLWVADNKACADDIVLGINIDDAGRRGKETHISFYDCPGRIEDAVRETVRGRPGFAEGPQWFQGDHALFGLYGRQAIAAASSDMAEFMAHYAHTERDTIELADPEAIAATARFLRDVIQEIGARA